MSVENKIKQLLSKKEQLVEENTEDLASHSIGDQGAMASMKMKKDTSKSSTAANLGDTTTPMQGSSEKASFEERDEDEPNQGAKVSSSLSNQAGTIAMKGDAKTVRTQAMEEVDVKTELTSIFGEDLSEEFRAKATSIFEAAVIARINSEMDKIVVKLEEQNAVQLQEYKDTLVEKVDSYLNYVVEQWMQENEVAIESGLRSEITEGFIVGLKNLFKESYIEVPEEKYDVLDELTSKVETLTFKLDETIQENIGIVKEFTELKKKVVLEEQVKDLASTEAEKLVKLVEGVEFESEDLFREKVSVIKENYFPKTVKVSAEKKLQEEVQTSTPVLVEGDTMSKYVQSLSRTIKSR